MTTGHPLRQRGFTAVESLISTAITALVFGTLAPSFDTLAQQRRLEGAAAQLESELQFAKGLAVAGNRGMRFTFETSLAGSCYMIHTGGTNSCHCAGTAAPVCEADTEALRTVHFEVDAPVTVKSNSKSFAFDPTLGTVTPTATLELRNRRGDVLRLIVNIMGRVRSCTPTPGLQGYKSCG